MLDNYPIPKAEDLFTTFGGREKFTKLDLNHQRQASSREPYKPLARHSPRHCSVDERLASRK